MILAADLNLCESVASSASVLTKGQKLTEAYIRKIRNFNIEGAFVEAEKHSTLAVKEMSDENIKTYTLCEIRKVFSDFKSQNFVLDETHVKKLSSLADDLVRYILTKKDFSMSIFDLQGYDDYTFHHSLSVAVLCITTGIKLEFTRSMLNEIALSALLHDIGKLMIPIEIINKPGALTDEEFKIMKRHPNYAVEQLSIKTQISDSIISAIQNHHEKYNGTGYPTGKTGKNIPLFGRILTICDIYDALISNRPYRKRWFPGDVIEYMMAGSEVYFDQEILTAFLRSIAIYPVGCSVFLSNGKKAVVTKNQADCNLRPIIRIVNRDGFLDNFVNLLSDFNYTNVVITGMEYNHERIVCQHQN